jgi:hypothetical protein
MSLTLMRAVGYHQAARRFIPHHRLEHFLRPALFEEVQECEEDEVRVLTAERLVFRQCAFKTYATHALKDVA